MSKSLVALFTQHPQSVDETYFEHMRFAASFAGWLALAACTAFVHAILPCMFEKTSGQIITKLYNRIHSRGT